MEKQSAYLQRRSNEVNQLSSQVGLDLDVLQRKIASARHAASSIKVAITNDWDEVDGCIRSYR